MLGLTESRWAHFKILRCKVSMQKHSFEKSWIQRCKKERNKKKYALLSVCESHPRIRCFPQCFKSHPTGGWQVWRCWSQGTAPIHPHKQQWSQDEGRICVLSEWRRLHWTKEADTNAQLNDLSLCPSQYRTLSGGRTEVLVLPPAVTWRHSVPQRPLSYTFCAATEKCMGCLLVGEHCEHEPLWLFFFSLSFFYVRREKDGDEGCLETTKELHRRSHDTLWKPRPALAFIPDTKAETVDKSWANFAEGLRRKTKHAHARVPPILHRLRGVNFSHEDTLGTT